MGQPSGGRPLGAGTPQPAHEESSRPSRPADVRGSGSESDEVSDELLELVALCLERVDSEGEDVVEEICAAHPEHAQELRQRIEILRRLGLSRPKTAPKPFGRYELLRELGRGGMGVVYLARDEQLGREVALKALAGPLVTSGRARSRFEREIRAVAQLKHPGIVPIYEVGEADDVPYFTMEYVEGRTLGHVLRSLKRLEVPTPDLTTTHLSLASFTAALLDESSSELPQHEEARGAPPSLPEELPATWGKTYVETICRFVIQVAEALGHAHAHGVVHRDVKPSNVLIDPRGHALLFDFGLARLDSDESLTLTGDFAGTPSYVSPEQARGRAVDHRTDVYSLGVTLFELLTLRRPFEGQTAQQVFRQLTSKDPPLPRRYNRLVPRDLETICLSALEKDAERRYQSAYELASDLRRFLEFRPVLARPAGLSVRAARLVRRNPAQALAVGLALLLVMGSLFGLFLHNRAIAAERDYALEQYVRAEELSGLFSQVLRSVDPGERGHDVTVRELLDEAAQDLDRESYHPLVVAPLREVIGDTYYELGLYENAEHHLRRALALYRDAAGEGSHQVANAKHSLARALHGQDRFGEAEPLLLQSLAGFERLYEQDDEAKAVAMSTLGALIADRYQDYERAEELFTDALLMRQRIADGSPNSGVADNYTHLGKLRALQGDLSAALDYHEQALEIRRELDGPEHPRVAFVLNNQAILMYRQGRIEDSEKLFRQVLDIRLDAMGEMHPEVAQVLDSLAGLRHHAGDYVQAEQLARRALRIVEGVFPDGHPDVARVLASLGQAQQRRRKLDDARRSLERALRLHETMPISDEDSHAVVSMLLANVRSEQGDLVEASGLFESALEMRRERLPVGASEIGDAAHMYGDAELERGELEHARVLLEEALSIHLSWLPDDSPQVVLAKRSLLELSLRASEWDAAGLLARELVEDYCALNAGQAMAAQVMRDLGLALWRAGELAEAELRAREALQLQRAYLPPLSPELGDTLVFLGQLLLDDERPEEAEALLFEALATLESNRGLDHLGTLRARALYGRVLAETGRAELAGSYLLDAWTRLLAHAGEEHEDTRMALELVRAHYARTGQPEPAALGEGGWLGLRSSP